MTGHTAENCKYLSAIDAHILDLLCSGRTEHISCNSVKKIPKRFFLFLLRMLQLFFYCQAAESEYEYGFLEK